MEKTVKNINDFLKSGRKTTELKFKYGYFLKIKKNISGDRKTLDIHTPGYDGEMEIKEALDWILWTLLDYNANGLL